jgi:hypothetical protein
LSLESNRTNRPDWSDVTTRPWRSDQPVQSASALRPGNTARSGRPGWSDVTTRPRRAVSTITERRDVRAHFLAQACDLGTHLGHDRARLLNERTRLRFDQSPFAIPLTLLIGEDIAERLMPRLKN